MKRRDYVIVPLLIAGTTICMFSAAELGTRMMWPEHEDFSCNVKDKLDMPHPKPNCTSRTKIPEGPWVTYHFNECGYRTYDPCGPKPPGTLRLVFLGSSITEGYNVPYDDTYPVRAAHALAAATGRKVQMENLAFEGMSPLQVYRDLNQTIALQPDLVVYGVTPFDLEEKIDPVQLAARDNPNATFSRQAASFDVSFFKKLQVNVVNNSRTFILAQHLLFTNTDTYLRLSWSRGDKTDYLREPLSPRWQDRFSDFNLLLTEMASRLRKVGIPLMVVAIPSHQIAALLTTPNPPPHSDPFEFGRNIQKIAVAAGAGYVDATSAFSRVPDSDRLFYLVESHLTGQGNALVAKALTGKCMDAGFPAFKLTSSGGQ